MKKVLSTLAIYNDYGFLASVGEVTPGTGDNMAIANYKNPGSGLVGKFLRMLGIQLANQRTQ